MEENDLSPPERLLLRILRDFARGKKYCWPGQARLAELMGLSERSVRKYLWMLQARGFIGILQSGLGRTNRYVLIESASDPDRQALSGLDRQALSGLDRQALSGLDRQALSGPHIENSGELNTEGNKGSSSAAAADQSFLTKMGLPAEELAGTTAFDVAQVAAHIRERTGQQGKKPIGVGYLVSCVRQPKSHGFIQTAEGWHRPVEQNLAARKGRVEAKARLAELRAQDPAASGEEVHAKLADAGLLGRVSPAAEAKIDAAAMTLSADAEVWAATSEEERTEITTAVMNALRARPLMTHDTTDFKLLCLAEMKRRRELKKE